MEFISNEKCWTFDNIDRIIPIISRVKNFNKPEIYNLNNVEFFHPIGICLLTAAVIDCKMRKRKCGISLPHNVEVRKYLEQMGFEEVFFNDNEDYIQSENSFSELHLPVQHLRGKNAYIAEKIVGLFNCKQDMKPSIRDSLMVSINELMNNVFDHSESPIGAIVCSQMYPSKNYIKTCFLDLGIGIRKSLQKNAKWALEINSDEEAILLAFKNGVSRLQQSRGLGLATLNEFLKVNEGSIDVISGESTVSIDYDSGNKKITTGTVSNFEGTAVEITVRTDKGGLELMDSQEGDIF